MSPSWDQFKRFWTAEEVPRWIGFSLISLLLFGLGAVAYRSVGDTRAELASIVHDATDHSIKLLATVLADSSPTDTNAQQRLLREFARQTRCEDLRVVGADDLVLASIGVDEIGKPNTFGPDIGSRRPRTMESHTIPADERGPDRRVVRVPVPLASPAAPAGDARASTRTLEVVLATELSGRADDARIGTGVIVLTVITVFFLIYRLMRRHFRSMVRISDNLMARGEQLEQDLESLRLSETESALAQQWNRLIDLIDELSSSSRRASASAELKEVLEKSHRGELADVVDVIPDGVLYVVDRQVLAYANTMARRLLGVRIEADERVPLGDLEVSDTGRRIIEQVAGAVNGNGSFGSVTSIIEVEDGATSYRVRVLPFGKRKHLGECVVTITDVSQQVRADRAAEDFVSQVTHELRTPLTNIRAYAETLSSGVFDDPKVITECYNVIMKETRRLSRLIEDILSISQLEVGTIQLRVDDVDLRTLMTESVRDLRALADEKQIDMQLSLPSKLPVIRGDRDKLAVVVNNLLGNALKYTQSGGSVRVGCQVSAEEVLITVKDTGMGIDPKDHDRIFEKFQRGSSPDVEEITGTGIGLTTAREIARRHGGDIVVMSSKGDGATFVVHIPVREESVAAMSALAS